MLRPPLAPRLNLRAAACGLLAAAALTLAACGGSSTTTVTATGSAPTTATTATTATTSGGATSTTSTGTSTASDVRALFDTALRKNLVQQQGLSSAQADCVLNELQKNLPDSQIQATISGQVPKEVTDAAFKAGLKCANQ
jgi:hypothetical protein